MSETNNLECLTGAQRGKLLADIHHALVGNPFDPSKPCLVAIVRRSGFRIFPVAVSCFLLFVSCTFAQQFSIAWAKISAVSSTSSGGGYSVSGAIGQTVAGTMSGGNYSLENSQWGVIAGVQTSGVPLLAIAAAGHLLNGDFQLALHDGNLGETYMLQASTNLTDWVTVLTFTCTDSPMYVVDPDAGNHPCRFYRIIQ